MQGVVRAALVRVREAYAGRARLLGEEALALQEGLDAARHAASERADENAAAAQQVASDSPPVWVLVFPPGSGNNANRIRMQQLWVLCTLAAHHAGKQGTRSSMACSLGSTSSCYRKLACCARLQQAMTAPWPWRGARQCCSGGPVRALRSASSRTTPQTRGDRPIKRPCARAGGGAGASAGGHQGGHGLGDARACGRGRCAQGAGPALATAARRAS